MRLFKGIFYVNFELYYLFLGNVSKEYCLAADMECLCQFLTTVGKFMDTPKAKKLMNQYFMRLALILERGNIPLRENNGVGHNGNGANQRSDLSKSKSQDYLPARIRFMLEDLIDLKNNNWVPKRAGQRSEKNKPRYLKDIRLEIYKVY